MVSRPHMTKVRAKNTKPELRLRRFLWSMGYRGYRIHYAKLPGKPDVAFTRHKKVIFMHGCFWHGHDCRAGKNTPSSNKDYWRPKLERNKLRDKEQMKELKKMGWDVKVFWECELKDVTVVKRKLERFCAW